MIATFATALLITVFFMAAMGFDSKEESEV